MQPHSQVPKRVQSPVDLVAVDAAREASKVLVNLKAAEAMSHAPPEYCKTICCWPTGLGSRGWWGGWSTGIRSVCSGMGGHIYPDKPIQSTKYVMCLRHHTTSAWGDRCKLMASLISWARVCYWHTLCLVPHSRDLLGGIDTWGSPLPRWQWLKEEK